MADAARRAGRGDDDLDAALGQAGKALDGLLADLLGVVEQGAVEVDGDEADIGAGTTGVGDMTAGEFSWVTTGEW